MQGPGKKPSLGLAGWLCYAKSREAGRETSGPGFERDDGAMIG